MIDIIRGVGLVVGLAGCVIRVECVSDPDCASDELCWEGRCEPAMDRDWSVEIVAASVDWVHPDGLPWDTDGSPPDLYAEFGLPYDHCLTGYVPDSYDPVWYESCDFYVPYDPDFYVDLWDTDGAMDELGTSFDWSGADGFTALARTAGHEVGWVDPSGTVLLWVAVRPF